MTSHSIALLFEFHEEYQDHGKYEDRGKYQEASGEDEMRVYHLVNQRPQSEAEALGALEDTEDELARRLEFEGRCAIN